MGGASALTLNHHQEPQVIGRDQVLEPGKDLHRAAHARGEERNGRAGLDGLTV